MADRRTQQDLLAIAVLIVAGLAIAIWASAESSPGTWAIALLFFMGAIAFGFARRRGSTEM